MLRNLEVLLLTALFGLSSASFADQVTFKNGDRLTGTVVKSDGKTLTIHTDAAGDIDVKLDSIQEIKTEAEEHVGLKGGKTEVGPVTTSDGKLDIATKSGTVEAPTGDVTWLRDDAEETAHEKKLHPGLMHGWEGGINVGFSVARGNSETENLALAFNADHPTENDKITMYATSINTTNNLATPSTVANLTTGGIRYDRNLTPRLFAFFGADYTANALQFLDLRQVYGGGLGVHVIKNDNTVFDLMGGINYTHETYSNGTLISAGPPPTFVSYGVTNRFIAATIGEEWDQKFGKSTVLTQTAGFFPNLQETGEYRFIFNAGTVTKLNSWLGWQNQFGNIYVTNPPIGTKKNDVIFTTGLSISFNPSSK